MKHNSFTFFRFRFSHRNYSKLIDLPNNYTVETVKLSKSTTTQVEVIILSKKKKKGEKLEVISQKVQARYINK